MRCFKMMNRCAKSQLGDVEINDVTFTARFSFMTTYLNKAQNADFEPARIKHGTFELKTDDSLSIQSVRHIFELEHDKSHKMTCA